MPFLNNGYSRPCHEDCAACPNGQQCENFYISPEEEEKVDQSIEQTQPEEVSSVSTIQRIKPLEAKTPEEEAQISFFDGDGNFIDLKKLTEIKDENDALRTENEKFKSKITEFKKVVEEKNKTIIGLEAWNKTLREQRTHYYNESVASKKQVQELLDEIEDLKKQVRFLRNNSGGGNII